MALAATSLIGTTTPANAEGCTSPTGCPLNQWFEGYPAIAQAVGGRLGVADVTTTKVNKTALEKVTYLVLSNNQLTRLPTGFGYYLPNLTYLDLSNNQIKVLDLAIIRSLTRLQTLIIDNNLITCLPNAPTNIQISAVGNPGYDSATGTITPTCPTTPTTTPPVTTPKPVTPKVTVKLAKSTIKKSQAAKVTVQVTANGMPKPVGTIKLTYGTKAVSKNLTASAKGKLVVTLPKLKKGTYKINATFTPKKGTDTAAKVKAGKSANATLRIK